MKGQKDKMTIAVIQIKLTKRIVWCGPAYAVLTADIGRRQMTNNEKEQKIILKNQNIIVQLVRLLEQQNLITIDERMKITELLRKGQ